MSSWRSRYRDPLQLTLMASAWLLLIAYVNLAGLQFARGLRREREVGVSRALGATAWDVIAPTVAESLLLSLGGLLLGAPLADWGARFATDLLSTAWVPLALDLAPDWRTWSVLATGSVMVTIGAGLIPAWLATTRAAGLTTTSRVVPGQGDLSERPAAAGAFRTMAWSHRATTSDTRALAPSVAGVVDELGHEFVIRADTLTGYISRSLARERLLAGMAGVYGSLAIAMVAIGLGALLSQDVTRRRREFGVRLSVGASPMMLYQSVTTRAVRLTAAGIGLGGALTWMLTQVLASALGVDSAGVPWVLAGVTSLLLILAVGAAAGPARQAARTEPMDALRTE